MGVAWYNLASAENTFFLFIYGTVKKTWSNIKHKGNCNEFFTIVKLRNKY